MRILFYILLCINTDAFSFFPLLQIRNKLITKSNQQHVVTVQSRFNNLKSSSKYSSNARRRILKLWSSKQQLSLNKIPTLVNKEDLNLDFDSVENKHKLSSLTDFNNTVSINSEELQAKWIDICIDENRPEDLNNFSLSRILPYILNENSSFQINNRTLDHQQNIDQSFIYITEQELKRLWEEKSIEPMGKSINKFNIDDSLLLLEDDEDFEIMGIEDSRSIITNEKVSDSEIIEEPELVITLQELQRIWNERSQITWGLPSKTFDEQSALLLLDTEEDDDEDSEIDYVSVAYDIPEDEDNEFWNKHTGKSFQLLRETLKRMKEDLDDNTYTRPAWKKERNFLTPDIDTQEFMGDIMHSNTYLTQRIPANWDDPERDEMSDTYLSTGTMAWPGEEETDFNAKIPVWEELQLPFGPEYSKGEGLTFASLEEIEEESIIPVSSVKTSTSENGEIDWSAFDFSKASVPDAVLSSSSPQNSEIDDFFSNFESSGSNSPKEESSDLDTELSPRKRDNGLRSDSSKFTNLLAEPFVTPREWVENEEFRNHVGFEVWSNYPPTDFEAADDVWRDDDVYLAQSMKHIITVTDEYLYDHLSFNEINDEKRYWERVLWSSLNNQNYTVEEIPFYLTPDKDRGIKYSDEVIEMKGKMTLHPFLEEPEVAFKDDIFTHNTELDTLNKIGTIREQYDWQPREDLIHLIEEEKLERLQPLLRFANHIAVLQSTKDNILIFEYRGLMRHLIGIRASMIAIAKECFPEFEDLLLETKKTADKFDF